MDELENISPRGVPVVLDKKRTLLFTNGGMKYIVRTYGGLQAAFAALADGAVGITEKSLDALADFTYAGLLWEDPELTRAMVDTIIELAMYPRLTAAIQQALGWASPELEEGVKNPPK